MDVMYASQRLYLYLFTDFPLLGNLLYRYTSIFQVTAAQSYFPTQVVRFSYPTRTKRICGEPRPWQTSHSLRSTSLGYATLPERMGTSTPSR
jgi:hypothetical protein